MTKFIIQIDTKESVTLDYINKQIWNNAFMLESIINVEIKEINVRRLEK